jgi:hypothetical protein
MQQSSFKLKQKKIKHLPPTNFHSDARCASKKQRKITAATHSNYSGKRNNPTQNTLQNNQCPCCKTETTEEQNETGGKEETLTLTSRPLEKP